MDVHIVLSYDLGLKGDYPSLYSWLDEHKAIECGNSLAAFSFSVKTNSFDTVVEALKSSLESHINFEPTDRIYIITKDGKDDRIKGKFIFGNRKRAPWEGYFQHGQSDTDIF
ncbi:hypothetical protein [Elizabethkingia anophelis]|uniref:hypothetical protein n=1 Tax=Elizabethkingia anophelis TaxID=1117645 RepID=UPI0021A5A5C0|nr:hypothetical protein [Elizabethkingia anophelis]MCT4046475.1 hypothetical protein [Elizabethkingia anophelis]CAH1141689.1 hypothetical protein EAVVTKC53_00780 [Elizabethkingia anophelis]CAI9684987.1 hypothetical protein EAVVTKC53_02882 [Elizabethkingia anophelis]